MPIRNVPSIALFVLCFLLSYALAQQVQLTEQESAYVGAFDSILQGWQSGEIKLAKTVDVEETFGERIELFKERQGSLELEQIIPVDFIFNNYTSLPDTLEPMPLSRGAYLVLLGGLVDAVPELVNQGIQPTLDSMLPALELPLFLTLGAAEKEVEGDAEIDSIAIRRGGVRFFSLGWPFCCAE